MLFQGKAQYGPGGTWQGGLNFPDLFGKNTLQAKIQK